jgi:hypothetical protein
MILAHSSFGKPKTPELIAGILTESTFISFAISNVFITQLLSKSSAYILFPLEYLGPIV